MRKLFTSLVLLVPAIAGAAGTVTLPLYETFDSSASMTGYTIIDANDDGTTWEYYDYWNCVRVPYSDELATDDWLITPAIAMEAGTTYKIALDAKGMGAFFGNERFEVMIGTKPTADGMTGKVIEATEVKESTYATYSATFTPTESGTYYVGIHGCSEAGRYGLFVDNLQVSAGVSPKAPAAATGLTLTPDATGLAKVSIAFTAPSKALDGTDLASLEKVEVLRDKKPIATLSATPGQALTYVDETVTLGTHEYVVAAYNTVGRGEELTASVFVGPGKPAAVTNFKVTETQPGVVTLSWTAPTKDENGKAIDPSLITYKVVYYDVVYDSYYTEEPITDGLTDTQYVHTAIAPDAGQLFTAYGVYAETVSGRSTAVKTALFPVGTSYAAPYTESFANGETSSLLRSEVVTSYSTTPAWQAVQDKAASGVVSRDGDNGYAVMAAENIDDSARYYTGKIDLTGIENPGLSFFVYNFYNGTNADDLNPLEIYVSTGSGFVLAKEMKVSETGGLGWNKVIVPLDKYAGKTVQIVFFSSAKSYVFTPIDAIRVGSLSANDLTALAVEAPESVQTGADYTVNVIVENAGTTSATDYTVTLRRSDGVEQTLQGTAIASCAKTTFSFTDRLSVFAQGSVTYTAMVNYAADENTADNTTAEVSVDVAASQLPAPTSLTADKQTAGVALQWTAPIIETAQPDAVTDDFESYESYTKAETGGWTMIDVDEKQVGKLDITIPEITLAGSTQAFWVMDADCEGANSLYAAHSGKKYLAQIFNNDNSACDDWAVSPELYGSAQTVSFYAKSYSSYPSFAETFEILYSTGGKATSDFTLLATCKDVPNEWTKYEQALPEGTKYFAIRCISEGCYMLFVDDVTYIPANATSDLSLEGYNVYRNGEKLNAEPLADTAYTDATPASGKLTYTVTAVYNRGESSTSNEAVVDNGGVDTVASSAVSISVEGNRVSVTAAEGGIAIYNASGVTMASTRESSCTAEVATGVYLVKTAAGVRKVIVK